VQELNEASSVFLTPPKLKPPLTLSPNERILTLQMSISQKFDEVQQVMEYLKGVLENPPKAKAIVVIARVVNSLSKVL